MFNFVISGMQENCKQRLVQFLQGVQKEQWAEMQTQPLQAFSDILEKGGMKLDSGSINQYWLESGSRRLTSLRELKPWAAGK
jgi:hypothetical protein